MLLKNLDNHDRVKYCNNCGKPIPYLEWLRKDFRERCPDCGIGKMSEFLDKKIVYKIT